MNLLTYFFTIFLQKEDPRGKEKEEVNTYFFSFSRLTSFIKMINAAKIFSPLLFWL